MGQSSYSKADSFLTSQEIYRILWHPITHHRVNNISPLASYPDPGETPFI
jgi:hypothetical protein